ncbi:glycosyltransferase [Mucilaginibacter terrae]|uniref:Cellulose synthase/poly-beta-1,6-N-acetylglucosamine synthase-like glycosyltransferase n=1 Tax=Mucilaginibacter terrae TaxID=1955052 RepID=A0ABU3GXQ8_9SPHI|nr:glycosyltransferase [Mucilaginibacter terrae]MDT3404211.1 cellulose synthase/poly-beta-1,6-N-acetylglucosamine synthase-like glycosyltransferase [Mucilaginibacter terrae]
MAVVNVIWIVFQVLIGYNLVLPILLYIFYSLKSKPQILASAPAEVDYAIIVTAYEWVTAIPEVVNSLLQLNYNNYLIYVVADKCDISSLHFDDPRVIILRPEETLAGNVRSHFYAINRFRREHERLTIIDSDNLVEPEYLNELNKLFNQGFEAVQGIREAKNLDTTYARLDGARDIYYHFYDGKILFQVGSSATLAGSGMAFTTKLYRNCLENRDVSGAGFDKVLQAAILSQNKRIAFTDKAIVWDEKTTHSDQLVKQRARWINTWFKYFKYGFTMLGYSLKNFSLNQFVFGLILLRPPLFIFLILSVFCMLANVFISWVAVALWMAGFLLFVLGFYIALAKSHTDARIYQSLINIPKFYILPNTIVA